MAVPGGNVTAMLSGRAPFSVTVTVTPDAFGPELVAPMGTSIQAARFVLCWTTSGATASEAS